MRELEDDSELKALISLLDDPDNEVYSHVSGKLTSYGPQIIPKLEVAWEETLDNILQERIEQIIHQIQLDDLKKEFERWLKHDKNDLYKGAVLVAKYQYPELDEVKLKTDIDHIRRAIWLEMNYHLTPFEQVNVFNHVFYTLMGFTGKTPDKPDINSFYLNNVVESKRGNSLSLGLLYLIIAQDLDMPVYGVDLPKHFVLSFTKDFMETLDEDADLRDQVIFYINALNKGTIFTRNEITLFLKKMNLEPQSDYFIPRRNNEVIKILLQNMVHTFREDNQETKAKELEELIAMFE